MTNPKDPLSIQDRSQLRGERGALKAKYLDFFAKVSALMFEHDPMGINVSDNTAEYDPEAGTVIPRIESCKNASELTDVVYEEFCRWFGPETAGPKSHYQILAQAIWALAAASHWGTVRGEA